MSDNCLFCPKPEKQTTWWYEDDVCLAIENISGGSPLMILKRHTTEPTEDEIAHIEAVMQKLFDTQDYDVIMAHVKNHWHCHPRNYGKLPDQSI